MTDHGPGLCEVCGEDLEAHTQKNLRECSKAEDGKKYTLTEAQRELQRRECGMYGHDLDIIYTDMIEPVGLRCQCGLSWSVRRSD